MPGREEMSGPRGKVPGLVIAIFIMTLKCHTILGNYQRPPRPWQKGENENCTFCLTES